MLNPIKINEIVNKYSFAVDKFMKEMHGFTYSACGPFTKNKERIRKFKGTGYELYLQK